MPSSKRQKTLSALGVKQDTGALTQEVLARVLTVPLRSRYALSDRLPGFYVRVGGERPGAKGKPVPGPAMYWAQARVNGVVKQVKVGTAGILELSEARTLARQVLAQLHRGVDLNAQKRQRAVEERSRITLRTYIDEHYDVHLDAMKAGASEKLRLLDTWAPLLSMRLDEITEADINRVLHARRKSGISDGSALRDWSALQALLRYAWKKKALAALPFRGRPEALEGAMHGERDRYLGQRGAEEVAVFRRVLDGETHEVRIAVLLLLATGMRRGELLGLRRENVDWKQGLVTIPKEKTKSGRKTGDRRVYLNTDALELLKSLKVTSISGYFFPPPLATWETRLKRCIARVGAAGVPNFTLHDLRRTYATWAFKAGARLEAVSKLLGHSKVAVTQRYAKLVDSELREAAAGVRLGVTPGV